MELVNVSMHKITEAGRPVGKIGAGEFTGGGKYRANHDVRKMVQTAVRYFSDLNVPV
jgi:hypothetical protein